MTEPAWWRQAKCAGLGDVMFPNGDRVKTRAAVEICRTCIVVAECGEFATATGEKYGVWGGRVRGKVRASGHSS